METANAVILFIASNSAPFTKKQLQALLQQVGDLMAPCASELHRTRHEDAAVAALTVDDERIRLAALEALFMHGTKACLPVLRGLFSEPHMLRSIKAAAETTYAAVATRCGEPGSVSVLGVSGALTSS